MLEWLGFIVGIVGLVIGWRYRPRPPKLVFQSQGFKIIESDGANRFDSSIEVIYNGEPVPSLTSSIIVLWNAGLGPIRKDDIVASDPVRCCVPDGARILRATIRQVTDPHIGFQAVIQDDRPNEVVFTFDHLNSDDGAVVEVLHTSKDLHPTVVGSIVGGSGSGRVTDLGTLQRPFPSLSDKKSRNFLWATEILGFQMRIPRSIFGWAIFLAVDAMVAVLFTRYVPRLRYSEYSFADNVIVNMVALPLTAPNTMR